MNLNSNWKHLKNRSGIYKITSPTGRIYIGQSIELYNRLHQHKLAPKQKIHSSEISKAIKEFGLDKMDLEILWECERPSDDSEISKKLDELEVEYINQFNSFKNGYNRTSGGKGDYTSYKDEKNSFYKLKDKYPTFEELLSYVYEYGIENTAEKYNLDVDWIQKKLDNKKVEWRTRNISNLIKKSKENPAVMELIGKHYEYLRKRCIWVDEDEDTFNDTVLKITYNYNPEIDFAQQFIHQFNLEKRYKYDEKKLNSYLYQKLDDKPDFDIEDIIEEDNKSTNNVFSKEDIQEFIEYANHRSKH